MYVQSLKYILHQIEEGTEMRLTPDFSFTSQIFSSSLINILSLIFFLLKMRLELHIYINVHIF